MNAIVVIEQPLEPGRYELVPVPEGKSAEPEPARVIAYSQHDSRWARIHLGPSRYTMSSAGCAVTAATMIATQIKPGLTPLDMVEWLNANGGFTSGGLLYWSKAAEAVDGLRFVDYHVWRKVPADVQRLRAALVRGAQVVQVDFRPGGALDSHFVVALSFTEDESDLNIIDPWTGERGTLLGLYGSEGWDLARAVYALAEFRLEEA